MEMNRQQLPGYHEATFKAQSVMMYIRHSTYSMMQLKIYIQSIVLKIVVYTVNIITISGNLVDSWW
jgi:hypothetical protein